MLQNAPRRLGSLYLKTQFSPDAGKVMRPRSERVIAVWDIATGRELFTAADHPDRLFYAAFSPDGRELMIGSNEAARLLDAQTGAPIASYSAQAEGVRRPVFCPEGWRLFTVSSRAGDPTMRWRDLMTGQELAVLQPPNNLGWVMSFLIAAG